MKKTPDHVPTPMSCADADLLWRCLGDQLDEEGEARMEHHVSTCRECQRALESEAGNGSWWQSVRENLAPETPAPEESAAPVAGTPQEQLREVIDYLAPTDDPQMIGRLGHYEVQGLIGRGSTGIVLKAFDRRLNRFVAIKLMSPLFQSNGAARRRFEREGRAVAAVSNDHVVPIYAVDEYRGLPYIVMKYIPGLSLQGRLDRDGSLDSCEAARIGFQVASALAAAHAQGVVHRDVKPANVMLEETVDRAMVTDFGLARVADEVSMTHSGTISGTPQFMSPEQARGEAVDLRSDIFSLGSLLYAVCTGHAPFRAQTLFGVLHRVCETEPRPIREVNPAIDEGLAALISALMVKRVEDRFQTADEVALAFAAELAYLQNPTGTARPVRAWLKPEGAVASRRRKSAPSSRRWVVALLAVVGLSAGAVAVVTTLNAPSRDSALLATSLDTRGEIGPDGPAGDDAPLAGAMVQWRHLPDAAGAEPGAAGQGIFQQTIEQVYELNPGDAVKLRIERGDVVIVPSESDEVTLRLVQRLAASSQEDAALIARQRSLHAETGQDGLTLYAGFGSSALEPNALEQNAQGGLQSAVFHLEVPRGSRVDVQTVGGSISIGELVADVKASARGGDVELAFIDGAVNAQTRDGDIDLTHGCNGDVELFAIRGDVRVAGVNSVAWVQASGGDIWLAESSGDVQAQTSGGDIFVSAIDGPTSAHAAGGDMEVRVPASPAADARFSAANGDVTVLVADSVSAEIEARGKLQTIFPTEVGASDDPSGEPWTTSRLNGGGFRLRVSSSTGSVTIRGLEVSEQPGESAGSNGSESSIVSGGSLGSGGSGGSGGSLGSGGSSGSGGSLGSGGSESGQLSEQAETEGDLAFARAIEAWDTGKQEAQPGTFTTVELPDTTSRMDGYTLYLPADHQLRDQAFPVLIFLQGGLGVGGEIGDVSNWGLPRILRDELSLISPRMRVLLEDFIVVSPHIQSGQYYHNPGTMQRIIDDVVATHNADPDRVFLTGLSRGGHGTWGLAARMPDTFAAIAPIAGSAGSVEGWSTLVKPAIWISHNRGDRGVSFDGALDAAENIQQLTGAEFRHFDRLIVSGTDYLDHRYILTSANVDNHDAWTDIYNNPEFYEWLLLQKRQPD